MSVSSNTIKTVGNNDDQRVNPKWYRILLVVNLLYVIMFYIIMQWVKVSL